MEVPELNGLIEGYYQNKESLDNYKKIVDEENAEIKKLMAEANIDEFNTLRGLNAKIVIQKRQSFNEQGLISKLKELGCETPIKTVEVIDYDELENVIYNNILDASKISEYKQIKEVVTLKVTKKKGD